MSDTPYPWSLFRPESMEIDAETVTIPRAEYEAYRRRRR